ncbi:MAG: peptidylprolyl isomerase [Pseudomonadota bacterium]
MRGPAPNRLWPLLAIFLTLVSAAPGTAFAQAIVAVVNDGLITDLDVEQRLRVALIVTDLPRTDENAARLRPQVISALIDEELQRQEAERLGIGVPEEEIDAAIAEIAASSGVSQDAFLARFRAAGVRDDTLRRQLEAQIVWVEVARRQLAGRVIITEAQVDQALQRLSRGERQFRIAELALPVYAPGQEERVVADAGRLREALRRGTSFAALARQFSASASAERGGDLGWVSASALPAELVSILETLPDGGVSEPIVTQQAVFLFQRQGERTTGAGEMRVDLLLADFGEATTFGDENLAAFVERAREEALSCPAFEALLAEQPGIVVDVQSDVEPIGLDEPLAGTAFSQPIGVASRPLVTDEGTLVVMVCRREGGFDEERRQQVRDQLRTEAIERLASRYLRNLRQDAFIEVRA